MAIVKILFRKNAENVIRYVLGHTLPGDPVDSECVPPNADGANAEFKMVRDQHRFKEGYKMRRFILYKAGMNRIARS